MLDSILSHEIETGSKKILPHWNQYVSTLKVYKEKVKKEFLYGPGYRSRIVNLLAYILNIVDLEYVNKKDDITAYIDYFQYIQDSLASIFDMSKTGYAYRNMFISKTVYSPNEYLIATEDVTHLNLLPWGKNWDEWKKIRCVHLWHCDSSEYTLNLFLDKIQFKWYQPKHAIFCIDPIILSMRYMKYCQDPTPEEDKGIFKFLHSYVMVELFEDLLDVWLFNQIVNIANCNNRDEVIFLKSTIPNNSNQYGYSGMRYEEASLEMFSILEDIKTRKIRPMEFLHSSILSTGSVMDRLDVRNTYLSIAHMNQMESMHFLMELPYLELLLKLYGKCKEISNYKNIIRELQLQLRRAQTKRIWRHIHDTTIQDMIQSKIENLYENIVKT